MVDQPNGGDTNDDPDADSRASVPPSSSSDTGPPVEREAEHATSETASSGKHGGPPTKGWFGQKIRDSTPAEWVMVLLTFVIAGGTVAYTFYAKRQWDAMAGQLAEMKSQTLLTRQQLKGTQAAVVRFTVDMTLNEEVPKIKFRAENMGHVIANNVTANLVFTVKTLLSQRKVRDPMPFVIPPQPVAPSSEKGEPIDKVFPVPGLVKQDWGAIGRGEHFVSVEWDASYDDGFGDKIIIPKTSLCMVHLAPLKWKGGEWSSGAMVDCGEDFITKVQNAIKSRKEAQAQQPKEGMPLVPN